jgi:hypothetical protein
MEILRIAEDSGLQVIVDGRVGREEYSSVHGSIAAFERFAKAILAYAATQPLPHEFLVEDPPLDRSM